MYVQGLICGLAGLANLDQQEGYVPLGKLSSLFGGLHAGTRTNKSKDYIIQLPLTTIVFLIQVDLDVVCYGLIFFYRENTLYIALVTWKLILFVVNWWETDQAIWRNIHLNRICSIILNKKLSAKKYSRELLFI